jgi:hypothetical protein
MVQMHSGLMMCFCTGLPFGTPDMACKAVEQPPNKAQVTASQHGWSMEGIQVSNISSILRDILRSRRKVDDESVLLSCLPGLTEKTLEN